MIYNQQQRGDSILQEAGGIVLDWYMDLEVTAGLNSKVRIPLMAYSCGENFLNELDTNTFLFHLDQDITLLDGTTLKAGTNLKGSPGVDIHYRVYYGGVYTILSEDFVRHSLQADTTYQADMKIIANDGLVLSNSEAFFVHR